MSRQSRTPPARDRNEPRPQNPPLLTVISGSEGFLVGRAVRRCVDLVRSIAPDAQRRSVDVSASSAHGELLAALSPSLFGEPAVVVIGDLAQAADDVAAALVAGLAELADQTWVVAVHSGDRNKALLEQLRQVRPRSAADPATATTPVEMACAPVRGVSAIRTLLEQEARRHGRRVTGDGVDALMLAVGSEVSLLVAALEQLLTDHPDSVVDVDLVARAFVGVAEVSGFQISDPLLAGDGRTALERLRWGMSTQTVSGPSVVGSLASGLRSMVRVAAMSPGIPDAEIARAAGVPPFKVAALRRTARGWSPSRVGDAVVALADVDAAVKGGLRPGENLEAEQKAHVIETFLLRFGSAAATSE